MFIRRTNTRRRASGEPYFTYRLVNATRIGRAVRQATLLNLGARFDLPQEQWPALAGRIEQILHGQGTLLAEELCERVETLAQRYAAQLLARTPSPSGTWAACAAESAQPERYAEIDLDSIESVRPRTVGWSTRRWRRSVSSDSRANSPN